ncbi:MAG: excinuclease ABC subunit UvrC [Actinomycetota bacterium]
MQRVAISPPPELSEVPDAPGCYLFRDASERVVYVGKAASLRKRLANYFGEPGSLHVRTRAMLEAASSVEWVLVRTELEALHLELTLIKEHRPRYNVRYRDDKSYPYLAVTLEEAVPRAVVMRGPHHKGVRYFGPYAHAYAIRETLDLLLRPFPVRTCSDGVYERCRRLGRPCLLADIEKCAAPCVGRVGIEEHRAIVEELCAFLSGRTAPVLERIERDMCEAAEAMDFERAARLRDRLAAAGKAVERQQMVSTKEEDLDVVAMAGDELEAALQVFFVRRGRVMGRRGWVVDRVEDLTDGQLLAGFLRQLYVERQTEIPPRILVPEAIDPVEEGALLEWLRELRGARVQVRVPVRGEKMELLETVTGNATEAFTQHRLKRAADFDARSRALRELQEHLGLAEAPLRIECFDVSHLHGSQAVGSMVVFEDGLARPSEYRHFRVSGIEAGDDVGSMREVLIRRLKHLDEQSGDEGAQRSRRFAYRPGLIVVDGGKPQLGAALEALAESGASDVSAISLAKRLEEVYVPGRSEPLVVPRSSEALYLLQRLRDEAHRFALSYHRRLRSKAATRSDLQDIAGVGKARRLALLGHFGSMRKLALADFSEIQAVPGVSATLAARIFEHLHGVDPAPTSGVGRKG